MSTVIIIFLIIATVFALGTLGYVIVDIVLESLKRREVKEPEIVEEIFTPVVPEPEPVEVMPEPVERIDAEQADAMISDSLAMQHANYEHGAGQGKQGIINIGTLDARFEAGTVITLALLKEMKMLPKNIGRLKILADGELTKPLTIKAEHYSVQAIKMIELTGGTAIILKD